MQHEAYHAYGRFQSTLPQGERLWKFSRFARNQEISIHAPTRGATRRRVQNVRCSTFQSTLPQGERLVQQYLCILPDIISIHAPTRGATGKDAGKIDKDLKFQSTLPQGERRCLKRQRGAVSYFNPRSHKGSD